MSCLNGIEGHSSSCIPSPSPSPLPYPGSNNGSRLFIYYIVYAAVIFYSATAIFRCFTRKNRFTRVANFILALPFWIIVYLIGFPFVFVFELFKIIFKSNPSRTAPSTTNNVTGGDKKEEITVAIVTGVDQSIIAILPTLTYKGNDREKCPICTKEVKNGDVMKFLPSCLHTFHVDCITKWLKSNVTCPICQVKISLPPAVAVAVIDVEEVLEPSTRSNNGGLGW